VIVLLCLGIGFWVFVKCVSPVSQLSFFESIVFTFQLSINKIVHYFPCVKHGLRFCLLHISYFCVRIVPGSFV
jgi:hypothetical protein